MATDNPIRYGFRAVGSIFGETPKPIRLRLASGYQGADANAVSCDLGPGDVLKAVNDGTVALAAGADTAMYVCTAVIQYWDGTVKRSNKVVPGGQGVYSTNYDRETIIMGIPINGTIFEVDCDDATTATTYAAYRTLIHNNVDHINSGDTTQVRANPRLDISTANTTNTLHWRILDVSPTQENIDYAGNYVKLRVTANVSGLAAGFAGTATGV